MEKDAYDIGFKDGHEAGFKEGWKRGREYQLRQDLNEFEPAPREIQQTKPYGKFKD